MINLYHIFFWLLWFMPLLIWLKNCWLPIKTVDLNFDSSSFFRIDWSSIFPKLNTFGIKGLYINSWESEKLTKFSFNWCNSGVLDALQLILRISNFCSEVQCVSLTELVITLTIGEHYSQKEKGDPFALDLCYKYQYLLLSVQRGVSCLKSTSFILVFYSCFIS